MKKYIKIILPAVLLVVLMAAAVFGYRHLSKSYESSAAGKENTADQAQQAEDFTMLDENGQKVKLSDYYDKPVVLNFWATWCGPCQMEMPYFDEMYGEYKDQVNFVMVNLTDGSRDTVESATAFKGEQGYAFPIFFDTEGEGVNQYGIMSIPMTFFIKEDGTVLSYQVGSMAQRDVKSRIAELLK